MPNVALNSTNGTRKACKSTDNQCYTCSVTRHFEVFFEFDIGFRVSRGMRQGCFVICGISELYTVRNLDLLNMSLDVA